MAQLVILSGSPSAGSRTLAVAQHLAERVRHHGHGVDLVSIRDLPAEALVRAQLEAPALREALALVERAQAVLVATPLYKAAYTGVLKAFLDLLPQAGLAGKLVLPLATGGTLAHFLALDYALRPVLQSLGAPRVLPSLFLLDSQLERRAADTAQDTLAGIGFADEAARGRVDAAADQLLAALRSSP